MGSREQDNARVRDAWNANARFWDDQMGDGNDFLEVLVWPAVERLLGAVDGSRVLDVACGNGVTTRRLAAMGANVVAIDFSEELIVLAKGRAGDREIDYRVVDATDYDALMALGEASFAAVLCNMALMDFADVDPLMMAVARLLRPGGAFVFSVLHPCFNNPSTIQVAELEDHEGAFETTYSVKISRYLTPYTQLGAAMHGQPSPHPYFHRSLGNLIGSGFGAGLVLDGLEERGFPADHSGGTTPLSWSGKFSDIPPVLIGRMRRAG